MQTCPGVILQEKFLEPMGISQVRFAREINVPLQQISDIVRGSRSITTDIAYRLAHYFGLSQRFWLNLQAKYDVDRVGKLSRKFPMKQSLRYSG